MNAVAEASCEAAFPAHVLLPEPPANRAQIIPGSILQRWLSGVIQHDVDGYALIAGSGHTVALLYGDGRPLRSAVTRGESSQADDAMIEIESERANGCFVMTYKLPGGSARLLSGLFDPPARCCSLEVVDERLRSELSAEFDGVVVARADEIGWSVILVSSGDLVASYGADERVLGDADVTLSLLRHAQRLDIAHHPLAQGATAGATLPGVQAESYPAIAREVRQVEAGMIELLSLFEHRLSSVERAESPLPFDLAVALAEICEAASVLDVSPDGIRIIDKPRHPVLAAHWDEAGGKVATGRLLRSLQMADIPEAWVNAADALLMAIDRTVESQLTWLAVEDEISATTLREALDELISQSQALIRGWRTSIRRGTTHLRGRQTTS